MMVGIMVAASLNAASYFLWSEYGGNLLGTRPDRAEAIGWPFVFWEKRNRFGRGQFAADRFRGNLVVSALVGGLCGLLLVAQRKWLNRIVADFFVGQGPPPGRINVSLRGLLLNTFLAAVGAGVLRLALRGQAIALGAVYAAGPWVLIGIVFLPRGVSWQKRVALLIPLTVLMILSAFWIASSLSPSPVFERVLFGIFVCWTPQTTFAAVLLTLGMIIHRHFKSPTLDVAAPSK